MKIYKKVVRPIYLIVWACMATIDRRVLVFDIKTLKIIIKINWRDRISDAKIR